MLVKKAMFEKGAISRVQMVIGLHADGAHFVSKVRGVHLTCKCDRDRDRDR